ncbi:MAG: HlyD family efflux transporter periplasmic adaptor subunit [Phycisphaeraceae bacterium]|nr:HlyD family efflux transporter periplasmic adaptor subunit [Phycisphaeraceae bacterium]
MRTRHLVLILFLLGAVAALTYALWPASVPVDLARVERGPLRTTVDEDGKTRLKERYIVSAPLAGRLSRVTLREGDAVTAGQTILATIDPMDPSLLDPRALAEATARVRAAEAALERAGAAVRRAAAAQELAQSELARLREATAKGAGSTQELQRALAEDVIRREELRAVGFDRDIASFELEQARAALLHSSGEPSQASVRFDITAPVSGRVLRVIQESAAVVTAGSPLIEVGDPTDLELVIDVLSTDAVAIRPGAQVSIEHWGGEAPLSGHVRLVEPAAFTKFSALGVEEQRVNVIIDLDDAPEARPTLGDGYRVEARIVTWESPDTIKVPTSALFRTQKSWAVFLADRGRAVTREVALGRRNADEAQVLSGLEPGDTVVAYPGDKVRDGVRIAPRRP